MKLLFGYPTVNLGPMSRGKLHAILITVDTICSEGYQELCKEVGSISPTEQSMRFKQLSYSTP